MNEMNFKFAQSGIDEIRYSYYDSSVPPQYHRSYTITVTAVSLSIIVDSYGDIIADKKVPCHPESIQKLLLLLDEGMVTNTPFVQNEGCTGGTGCGLTCLKASETVFTGKAHYCGGKTTGDLGGNPDAFKTAIKELIPDFQKVLGRE